MNHSTGNTAAGSGPPTQDKPFGGGVSLAEATRVWAKIGLLSFGGPAGQIALMHRILVEEKGWVSERRFLHALNFCMLLPGPEAQQLATYIGWMLHRLRGGLVAGGLFILPGFAVILGLSYLYATAGSLPWVQALFSGLKPAVVMIVLQAVLRIGRRSLHSPQLVTLAVLAFVAMFALNIPFPYVILVAALTGWALSRTPWATLASTHGGHAGSAADPQSGADTAAPADAGAGGWAYTLRYLGLFGGLWLLPVLILLLWLGPDNVFTSIAGFFSKMAVVTFGGAYAVLAYVGQEAVLSFGWLAPGEMIDGLALAETTPGPLIMVVQFVGYLAAFRDPGLLSPATAGLLGAVLTTWVTFMPCFLWIFVGAPHIERLQHHRALSGALAAVTASVVGVIVNLALWFSIHALFSEVVIYRFAAARMELPLLASLQWQSLLITLVSALLIFRLRASILTTLAVASAMGLAGLWL